MAREFRRVAGWLFHQIRWSQKSAFVDNPDLTLTEHHLLNPIEEKDWNDSNYVNFCTLKTNRVTASSHALSFNNG